MWKRERVVVSEPCRIIRLSPHLSALARCHLCRRVDATVPPEHPPTMYPPRWDCDGWAHFDQTSLGHSASSHYISRPMPIRSFFPSCDYWESVSQLCSASHLLLGGNRRQHRMIKTYKLSSNALQALGMQVNRLLAIALGVALHTVARNFEIDSKQLSDKISISSRSTLSPL